MTEEVIVGGGRVGRVVREPVYFGPVSTSGRPVCYESGALVKWVLADGANINLR